MCEPPPGAASLYQRIGGHEAIAALVDVFTRRIAADAELAGSFAGRDLEGLRHHQAAFLAATFGGPHPYRGLSIGQAHRGLRIPPRHFQLVVEHLATALSSCGVPDALSAEVLERVAALRGEIVEGG